MRNTGQGGLLKTICPGMFFDFQAGGCVVDLWRVFLWRLGLWPVEGCGDVLVL